MAAVSVSGRLCGVSWLSQWWIRVTEATVPLVFSSTCLSFGRRKSNAVSRLPAVASKEPSPIRPVRQLFSMNERIEVSVRKVWST